ncbi:diguanylate cyclase [Paragemmobacter ruber]|uniref:diguanylate cyclase n=1 Tax=Paragemmobacter ruber TaxID=1985673 RepID=A0ABW9Y1M0_9RHOB|nr:diguanylate cyclase [Rhodobacter ruber]NBE06398.1 diguanylate cyclase [Rhodobacter ruber]
MAGKILIVDDVATNRIVLKVRLGAVFHETFIAADGAGALRQVRERRPDLLLLDLELPDMDGIAVLHALRADPTSRDLPVIVHTATTNPEARLAALRAGADDVIAKPADDQLLLARIRSLLRRRDPTEAGQGPLLTLQEQAAPFDWPGIVALTAFRPEAGPRLRRALTPLVPHRLTLFGRAAALGGDAAAGGGDAGLSGQPDAYLIDGTGDSAGAAFGMLSELRADPDSRHAGIALLTDGAAGAAMAFDLGADDAISPDVPDAELALRLSVLVARTRAEANRRASLRDNIRLAMTDPLTGLFNRRYALRRMGEMSVLAVDSGAGPAVMVIDIDRFKEVNDRHGHAAGDAVLVEVAARLSAGLAPGDLIARIGGEEFLIALPNRDIREAQAQAHALCAAIHDRPIPLPGGDQVGLTISIGLAMARPGSLPDEAIDRADRALLAAKMQGRNRVIVGRSAA